MMVHCVDAVASPRVKEFVITSTRGKRSHCPLQFPLFLLYFIQYLGGIICEVGLHCLFQMTVFAKIALVLYIYMYVVLGGE